MGDWVTERWGLVPLGVHWRDAHRWAANESALNLKHRAPETLALFPLDTDADRRRVGGLAGNHLIFGAAALEIGEEPGEPLRLEGCEKGPPASRALEAP